jgi:hypothetical protein
MVGFLTCVPSKVSLVLEVLGTDEASLKDDIDYQHDRSRSLPYQDTLAIYTRPTEGMQDCATAALEETLSRSGC